MNSRRKEYKDQVQYSSAVAESVNVQAGRESSDSKGNSDDVEKLTG
jgi:hypothetical protein